MPEDYYSILGISKNASTEEVKKSFRALARKLHPDVSKAPDATEKFKKINEAYSVLSDPAKRAKYDQFGTAEGFSAGQDFSGFSEFGDFGDIGSIFETFFGGGRGAFQFGGEEPEDGPRARNIRYPASVSLKEAFTGTERKVRIDRMEICGNCKGAGGFNQSTCKTCGGRGRVGKTRRTIIGVVQTFGICPSCRGRGETHSKECGSCGGGGAVEGRQELTVKIPAGVEDGTVLRVKGEGELGGDLLVAVSVEEDEKFKRRGADLLYRAEISFAKAALGGTLNLESIDGPAAVELPEGTQSGEVFTIQRRGMPSLRSGRRGDLLVKAVVITPRKLSQRQKELLRELDGEGPSSGTKKKGLFGI
ncbi:MAG: DnaJ C-terminal domain-containing protein [archaeon]